MPTPAPEIVILLATFAPAFTARTFANALLLLYGTLLAVGPRTVTAALRAVGRDHDPRFGTSHRVLNRAEWSALRLDPKGAPALARAARGELPAPRGPAAAGRR